MTLKNQKTHPKASVIIPNLNGKQFLQNCLNSLETQTFSDFEAIVVDNGSSDGSVEFIKNNFPKVKVIENKKNFGFAEANNQGLEIAEGEFIVTLNNDTIVDKNWLQELVNAAKKDEKVGMVASKILLAEEGNIIDSVGVDMAMDGMTKQRGGLEIDRGQYDEGGEILFPSACAALYKRKMIDEVGFFDTNFFAYCEDSDLGLRGRIAGWGAVCAPNAVVRHLYSQTGGKLSPFKLYLVERNHIWLVVKNFPLELLLFFPVFTLYRFFLQFLAVLAGRGQGAAAVQINSKKDLFKSVLSAYWDGVNKILFYIRQRRDMQSKRKISHREIKKLFKQHRMTFKELAFR